MHLISTKNQKIYSLKDVLCRDIHDSVTKELLLKQMRTQFEKILNISAKASRGVNEKTRDLYQNFWRYNEGDTYDIKKGSFFFLTLLLCVSNKYTTCRERNGSIENICVLDLFLTLAFSQQPEAQIKGFLNHVLLEVATNNAKIQGLDEFKNFIKNLNSTKTKTPMDSDNVIQLVKIFRKVFDSLLSSVNISIDEDDMMVLALSLVQVRAAKILTIITRFLIPLFMKIDLTNHALTTIDHITLIVFKVMFKTFFELSQTGSLIEKGMVKHNDFIAVSVKHPGDKITLEEIVKNHNAESFKTHIDIAANQILNKSIVLRDHADSLYQSVDKSEAIELMDSIFDDVAKIFSDYINMNQQSITLVEKLNSAKDTIELIFFKNVSLRRSDNHETSIARKWIEDYYKDLDTVIHSNIDYLFTDKNLTDESELLSFLMSNPADNQEFSKNLVLIADILRKFMKRNTDLVNVNTLIDSVRGTHWHYLDHNTYKQFLAEYVIAFKVINEVTSIKYPNYMDIPADVAFVRDDKNSKMEFTCSSTRCNEVFENKAALELAEAMRIFKESEMTGTPHKFIDSRNTIARMLESVPGNNITYDSLCDLYLEALKMMIFKNSNFGVTSFVDNSYLVKIKRDTVGTVKVDNIWGRNNKEFFFINSQISQKDKCFQEEVVVDFKYYDLYEDGKSNINKLFENILVLKASNSKVSVTSLFNNPSDETFVIENNLCLNENQYDAVYSTGLNIFLPAGEYKRFNVDPKSSLIHGIEYSEGLKNSNIEGVKKSLIMSRPSIQKRQNGNNIIINHTQISNLIGHKRFMAFDTTSNIEKDIINKIIGEENSAGNVERMEKLDVNSLPDGNIKKYLLTSPFSIHYKYQCDVKSDVVSQVEMYVSMTREADYNMTKVPCPMRITFFYDFDLKDKARSLDRFIIEQDGKDLKVSEFTSNYKDRSEKLLVPADIHALNIIDKRYDIDTMKMFLKNPIKYLLNLIVNSYGNSIEEDMYIVDFISVLSKHIDRIKDVFLLTNNGTTDVDLIEELMVKLGQISKEDDREEKFKLINDLVSYLLERIYVAEYKGKPVEPVPFEILGFIGYNIDFKGVEILNNKNNDLYISSDLNLNGINSSPSVKSFAKEAFNLARYLKFNLIHMSLSDSNYLNQVKNYSYYPVVDRISFKNVSRAKLNKEDVDKCIESYEELKQSSEELAFLSIHADNFDSVKTIYNYLSKINKDKFVALIKRLKEYIDKTGEYNYDFVNHDDLISFVNEIDTLKEESKIQRLLEDDKTKKILLTNIDCISYDLCALINSFSNWEEFNKDSKNVKALKEKYAGLKNKREEFNFNNFSVVSIYSDPELGNLKALVSGSSRDSSIIMKYLHDVK